MVVRRGNPYLTRGVEPTLESRRKSLGPYRGYVIGKRQTDVIAFVAQED